MPAQVLITSIDNLGANLKVTGFITLSGNYPTGGDPLNFTASGVLPAGVDPSFVGMVPAIESSNLLQVDVGSMGGAQIGANALGYDPACTRAGTPATISPATGTKLKCAALGASTEHAAGAYESQYTGDLVAFSAVFTKNL